MEFNKELEKAKGDVIEFAGFMEAKGYDFPFYINGYFGPLEESLTSHIAYCSKTAAFETAFPARLTTCTEWLGSEKFIRAEFRVDYQHDTGFRILGVDIENRGCGIGIAKRWQSFDANSEVPDANELNASVTSDLYNKVQSRKADLQNQVIGRGETLGTVKADQQQLNKGKSKKLRL